MLRRLLAVLVAVPLLSTPAWSQAAKTICKDGTTSAVTGRGACTSHGGVDKSATKKVAATAAAEKKAEKKAEKQATAAASAAAPAPSRARARVTTPAAASAAVVPARPAPASVPSAAPAMRPTPAATRPAPAPAASAAHASNTDPTGATAQCKDGTYSHATSHRGACARHQGVAKWL